MGRITEKIIPSDKVDPYPKSGKLTKKEKVFRNFILTLQ